MNTYPDLNLHANKKYFPPLSLFHSLIHSSMALQPSVGPWPLLQFRIIFTQTVGLLGRVISSSQGRYPHAGQHEHVENTHTQTFMP
jgi:hypothetical protein